MIRLDVVHIKLPQVKQLHTSMITEYSTVQYTTGTVLYCCHSVCLYLSVMLSQLLFPNFISLWIGLAVQHHNDTLQIKIYFRSLDFPQNQTFLKIFLVHNNISQILWGRRYMYQKCIIMYCLICNTFRMLVSLDTFVVIIAFTNLSNS